MKKSTVKVIVIDAEKKEIREQEIRTGSAGLSDLQTIVGGYIESAHRPATSTVLYVDEEGLFKTKIGAFKYKGAAQAAFVGSGVVCGLNRSGNSADCKMTLAEVKEKVTFL